MSWEIKEDGPIYLQLMEQIKLRIITGVYAPGEKLPSVRDLASEAAVNPNTMQKALSELEQDALISTKRTSGKFITEDKDLINKIKVDLAKKYVETFFKNMSQLGFVEKETIDLMNELKTKTTELS